MKTLGLGRWKCLLAIFLSTAVWGKKPAPLKTVSIAAVESFSGVTPSNIALAQNLRIAIAMALEDYGPALAKRGYRVDLREVDLGEEDMSVLSKTTALAQSDIVGVVGYNTSNRALLAAPIVQKYGLPMIATSATATRIASFDQYVHTASVSNVSFAHTLARVARKKWSAKKVLAVTAADCSYCTDLTESFKAEFLRFGGESLETIPVLSSQTDFSQVVAQVKAKTFDVILNPNHKMLAGRLIANLSAAGVQQPFLLADGWGSLPELLFFKLVGDSTYTAYAVDHWHPAMKTTKSERFSRRFRALSQRDPDTISALWYDSLAMMLEGLLRARQPTRAELERVLSKQKRFDGVTGTFLYPQKGAPVKATVLLRAEGRKYNFDSIVDPVGTDLSLPKMGARP